MSGPILFNKRNIYEQQLHNRRMTWYIMSGIILLLGVVGLGIDHFYIGVFEEGMNIPLATTAAVVGGVVFAVMCLNSGSTLVLKSTQAVEANQGDAKHRQLLNIAQEMSLASGLPVPKVYIIPDDDPNAFATGKDPKTSTIAVTNGLLSILDRDELQGVVAHEMSHIRYYDTRFMTTVAAFVGVIVLFSDLALRGLRFGALSSKGSRSRSSNPLAVLFLVLWILTMIFAPLLSRMMAMMISRKREYQADASAAELTRNPLALASALTKLENASAPTKAIKRGIAHLCVVDPMGKLVNDREGFWAELFATHPPMKKRIEFLRSMAYQYTPHA